MIAVVALMLGTVRWFSRFVIFNIGRDIEYDLRNDLFVHLSTLGTDFYMKYKTGDLMSRMINDLTAVRMMVGMFVMSVSNTPLMYTLALIFMSSLNRRLTLVRDHPLHRFVRRYPPADARDDDAQPESAGGARPRSDRRCRKAWPGFTVVKAYTLEEHDAGAVPQNQRFVQRAGARAGADSAAR